MSRAEIGVPQEAVLRRSLGSYRVPFVFIGLIGAVFLCVPILIILPVSVTKSSFLEFPPKGFSLHWYSEVLNAQDWRQAFWLSVRVSLLAAAGATVAGTAAALAVRRLGARSRRWLRTIFITPIVLPYIVYALGLYKFYDSVGIVGHWWTIPIGQAVLAFPIVFVAISAAQAEMDPAIQRAAASLGASWWRVVWKVDLPLLKWSIATAAVFATAFCFDEVVLAFFLSGPDTETLSAHLFTSAREEVTPEIAAVGVLVVLVALVAMSAAAALVRRAQKAQGATG